MNTFPGTLNLPERLQNRGILPPPKEKVVVILSSIKIQALSEIFDKPSKN